MLNFCLAFLCFKKLYVLNLFKNYTIFFKINVLKYKYNEVIVPRGDENGKRKQNINSR